MSIGLNWYKREPVAYLGDVQGLSAREHAVYSVVLDLIYIHGGSIRNDPKWIAGWISDMGSAAVRTAIAALDDNPRISITVTEDEISQKRAKTEVKTKRNHSETAAKSGKKGGKKSAEKRAASKENKDLDEPKASIKKQPEKRREEKINPIVPFFEEFWSAYPPCKRKTDKPQAHGTFLQIATGKHKKIGKTDPAKIVEGVRRYAQTKPDPEYIPLPQRWLNGARWENHTTETTGADFGAFGKGEVVR